MRGLEMSYAAESEITCQVVVAKAQTLQRGQVAKLRWYISCGTSG